MPDNKVTLKFHTDKVVKAMDDAASQKMLMAVNEVRNVTLETLSGSRHGRTYKVPGTQRLYTASAPGEAPAQATAGLRQSVETKIEGKGMEVIGTVGTDLEYGRPLEFGTKRMAARPWLKPSFEKAIPKIKAIFGGRWFG